ncbi:MAG: DJ-1 family glyoxalase III [Lachnospiraceae bacterium]|jgi:4-methyl-5(b-hydroxyethyl)-thiazole monophosphate biosynthesis|nr:DJ-1 family glyoxalase III [Lachnospiraceae bacterium]
MFEAKTDLKTAIFFADGCEEIEGLTVVDLLYRAGIPCTKVSINDIPEVTSSHEVTFRTDTTIAELDFSEYDMLILPGGVPGTPNLRACDKLMEEVVSFHKEGKQIAAICAAPGIFAELGLLKGIPATCNPSRDDLLTENGAILKENKVVVSGNIITSRAMGTAIPFGLAIVEHYLGRDTARALGENILYYNG